jgi:hypothetical protein
MKTKKIRGHKRRWKAIDNWITNHKNLDIEYLKEYGNNYAKIRVRPWSGIQINNSKTPEPKRATKQKILQGLIAIHQQWKLQLDTINEPYYLKIWLFAPQFSKSQVVCAIGDNISFYEQSFYKEGEEKQIQLKNYGALQTQLSDFDWEHCLDEESLAVGKLERYSSVSKYNAHKKWIQNQLKKPHRIVKEGSLDVFMIKRGSIWVGELKK